MSRQIVLSRLSELFINKIKDTNMLEESPAALGGHKWSKRDIWGGHKCLASMNEECKTWTRSLFWNNNIPCLEFSYRYTMYTVHIYSINSTCLSLLLPCPFVTDRIRTWTLTYYSLTQGPLHPSSQAGLGFNLRSSLLMNMKISWVCGD